LEYFKKKTFGKIIVMGGNTLLSFPKSKPLPGRTNIVLSDLFTRDDCLVCPDLATLFKELNKHLSKDIYVVGGAMFYKTMLDYCDYAYVTKVKESREDATVFFPNLDKQDNWELVEISEEMEDNGYKFFFTKYKNNKPKELKI
jgi:dihydrofolate reductase